MLGWPTDSGEVKRHCVVLLIHQTTSYYASAYYSSEIAAGHLSFNRHFAITEFNRSEQRSPYFFFKIVTGTLDDVPDDIDLNAGVQVPMNALVGLYSKMKLYDANPTLSYILQLIWENVVIQRASENPKFEHLRKSQNLEVNISVEDILRTLQQGFSFTPWHQKYPDRQPQVPKRELVAEACAFLVQKGEAAWIDESLGTMVVYYRKYDDVLAHFVLLEAETRAKKTIEPTLPGILT